MDISPAIIDPTTIGPVELEILGNEKE